MHDPLLAQAAFFANDAWEAFLIISLDATMYLWEFGGWGPGIREVKQAIAAARPGGIDLAPEQIVISSSHSHASTDLSGFYQDLRQGVDPELLAFMLRTLTDLAAAAAGDLREARLEAGETKLTGYTARDENCSPVLDTTVGIIRVTGPDGGMLLTIANFAKHPTVLPQANTEASADFVWGYRESMRERTGAPAMFLQGFIAAVHGRPNFSPVETMWDDARLVGEALSDAVLEAGPRLTPSARFDIRHRAALYSCQAKDSYLVDTFTLFDMPKRSVVMEGDDFIIPEIPLSIHRLGDIEFAVFPGEPTPEYSLAARARMKGPVRFTVGLGDDGIGYILDPSSVAADTTGRLSGYEAKTGLGLNSGPCAWEAFEGLEGSLDE